MQIADSHNFHGSPLILPPFSLSSYYLWKFLCFWIKTIEEMSEGADVFLDESCSFYGYFRHCTSAVPNLSWT